MEKRKNFSVCSGAYNEEANIREFYDRVLAQLSGLVSEIGMKRYELPYTQTERKKGKSSYNFFSYYDYVMVGFVNYSKLPLRLAIFSGFFIALVSLLVALEYFICKLLNCNNFQLGIAPLVIEEERINFDDEASK